MYIVVVSFGKKKEEKKILIQKQWKETSKYLKLTKFLFFNKNKCVCVCVCVEVCIIQHLRVEFLNTLNTCFICTDIYMRSSMRTSENC